jgi:FAD/FMN-containing dehydrogenase/Fe-S oxidoreductase
MACDRNFDGISKGMTIQPKQLSDDAVASELRASVRGEVLSDPVSRGIHATDGSHYQMVPACVVVPMDEDDLIAAVRIAVSHGLPITARGGGTSLAGQTFGPGLILDCSKYLNQVLEVNAEDRWARVQPGVVRDQLNTQLKPMGLHFAPDPATSSRANIGGMIGNNSSGTRSVIYGKTIDHVIAMKVLLADGTILTLDACDAGQWSDRSAGSGREAELYRGVGEIIRSNRDEIDARFPKTMRRVSGYNLDAFQGKSGTGPESQTDTDNSAWNLCSLIVGSEGTLAILLEATVRLVDNPKATAVCVVHFDDVIESLRHVPAMLEHKPSTVELLDDSIIVEARRNPSSSHLADFFEGDPKAVQVVEFMGDTQDLANERAESFTKAMRDTNVGYTTVIRSDAVGIGHIWELRKLGVGLASNIKGSAKPLDFVDDAAIPVEHLADYIRRLLVVCDKLDVKVSICAHASVGVLHPKPLLDLHIPEDVKKMHAIADAAFAMVKEYGGSWCGEHGDGLVRGEYIERFFGPKLYDAFRQVKTLFDPNNHMNPGKIIDTPKMTENLRYGTPGYEKRIAEVNANYHYRDQGGFALAVEQCNGLGACRKTGSGTMCPSYMATRDEEAVTRGRANALRLAMSGQLGPDALADDRLNEVLSLCLSCKACKSECPNAVDMAKLKSDVLQMRHDRHGTPLGVRLIGGSPDMARLTAGILAPFMNFVQSLPPFKIVFEKITGIDRRRTLPRLASATLPKLLKRRKSQDAESGRHVVLFDDTYSNYYEPQVGLAAVELLEGLGYQVTLAKAGCCQRPRLSKGLVKEAKRHGTRTLTNLDIFAKQGLPILTLEPSCASALSDDLPDLIDDEALGKRVAGQIKMIDTFLAEELDAGRLQGKLVSTIKGAMVHGHCHQKALFGSDGMARLLKQAGVEVQELDSGCCGMAGSFGYEHHDLSMKIGEQRLFPTVREKCDDTTVVACGFSCRHQVKDGCGETAKHFVEVVRAE